MRTRRVPHVMLLASGLLICGLLTGCSGEADGEDAEQAKLAAKQARLDEPAKQADQPEKPSQAADKPASDEPATDKPKADGEKQSDDSPAATQPKKDDGAKGKDEAKPTREVDPEKLRAARIAAQRRKAASHNQRVYDRLRNRVSRPAAELKQHTAVDPSVAAPATEQSGTEQSGTQTAAPRSTAQQQPANRQHSADNDDDGCGKNHGAAPQVRTDGPQPKLVCVADRIEIDPVWRGSEAVFEYEIRNEGEGPLEIQAKGG